MRKYFLSLLAVAISSVAVADPDKDCSGNPHHCNGGGGVSVPDVTTDISTDVTNNITTDVTNNMTTGDTVVNGGDVRFSSKALGLSNNLGDVAINNCRESTQWSTPLFGRQGVRLNPWCAAEVYDAKGMHKMAAIMRCEIHEVKQHFSSSEECVAANTYVPPVKAMIVLPAPEPSISYEVHQEEEERKHEDFSARLAQLEEQRKVDAARAAQIAQKQKEFAAEQRSFAEQALADLEEYRQ